MCACGDRGTHPRNSRCVRDPVFASERLRAGGATLRAATDRPTWNRTKISGSKGPTVVGEGKAATLAVEGAGRDEPAPSDMFRGTATTPATTRKAATPAQIAAANRSIAANPDRHRARVAVKDAVRRGKLAKGPCAIGDDCLGRVEAHHSRYDQPLAVTWLCARHHRLLHLGRVAA